MSLDKKIIIYEAALSLVNENNDLNRIKVADIAERANIGKSTVYEYFQSKEQVIAEALFYMFQRGIDTFEEIIKENRGFKETYTMLLTNLSFIMGRNRKFMEYVNMNEANFVIRDDIKNVILSKMEEVRLQYFNMVEKMVDMSVEEGIVPLKPSKYDWYVAVLSSMTCIFIHKQGYQEFPELTDEEAIEKAYNTFVKLLN